MKKLRLFFILFFILLALPLAYLLHRTYRSLEQESAFFYRAAAESVLQGIDERLQQDLGREEERPYTQYRYVHVADQALPQQEGLNLSPLSAYPVQSPIPGILGYFQIEPDRTFQTPLLPQAGQAVAVTAGEERARLRDRLFQIVSRGSAQFGSAVSLGNSDSASRQEIDAKLKKNLASVADISLEERFRQQKAGADDSLRKAPASPADAKSEPQVQRSSVRQAEIFDYRSPSESDARLAEESSPDLQSRLKLPLEEKEETAKPSRLEQIARPQRSDQFLDDDTVLAEVDPFRALVIESQWLVFYRKVWWHDQRYIQGFVASIEEFLGSTARSVLSGSALPPDTADLLFYDGDPLPSQISDGEGERPVVLYRSDLSAPLDDFHVALATARVPRGPGYQFVNWLAAFLGLLTIGGLTAIYRLTATQMELSQKKSDFVSAISHELKTPLTSIRMYGEMLMEGWVEDESKKQEYYRHIHGESERLSRLIQNTLRLAQLERNEWQVSLTSQDPGTFVANVVSRLKSQVSRAGFEIEIERLGEPRPIEFDTDALTQILINLVDNAIKFASEAEKKRIVIAVRQTERYTLISVRDFGPGIPGRKLKKIFEKFYRLNDEMTRTTQGTGIGLALVQMMATAMGARVDVANRNPGAEFSLRFD